MPIFKMKCRKCGTVFEALFKSASSKASCPECHDNNPEKLPSTIAVISKNNQCSNAAVCPQASCCCNGNCGGHR